MNGINSKNRKTTIDRLGMNSVPLPTNSIIGKGLPLPINSDNTYLIHNRLFNTISNNPTMLSSSDYVYIITNSNSIVSDSRIYTTRYGTKGTLGSAIRSAMIDNSTFLTTYHYYDDLLNSSKACSNDSSIQHTICSKDIYYIGIAIRHISICNMLSNICSNSGDYISTPTGSISIPTTIIRSDSNRHYYTALHYFSKCSSYNDLPTNSEIGKEYAIPTNIKGTESRIVSGDIPTTICPTRPINHIKRGSDAMSLYSDDRCIRYNNKTLMDILPVNPDITKSMSDAYTHISAMRIDSGIAPSIVWTGNSRDYMIIGIQDYDTTNYYCLYSSELYTDSEIYDSIYNTYNSVYSSYHKYAMDTKIHKYHSVFNDEQYISYAFDLQKGIVGKAPKLPTIDIVHNTYEYDSMYYIYKVYNDMFYDNMENIHYKTITTNCINCNSCSNIDTRNYTYLGITINHSVIRHYTKCIYNDYDAISMKCMFNPTKYFSGIIDSISSCDSYSDAITIAKRCKKYISAIISSIVLNTDSYKGIDSLLSAIDSVYYYTNKRYNSYDSHTLYDLSSNNCFYPYTIKLYKGYSGSGTTIGSNDYKPTYISGRLTGIRHILYANPIYRYEVPLHLFTYLGKCMITTDIGVRNKGLIKWYPTTYKPTTKPTTKPINKDMSRCTHYGSSFKRSYAPIGSNYRKLLQHINYSNTIKYYYNHIIYNDDYDSFMDRMINQYSIDYADLLISISSRYDRLTNPYGRK